MNYTLKTIQHWDNVVSLKNEWNALVQRDPESTIFQRFEWYQAWWDAYAHEGYTPFIITAYHSNSLVGIGPFMVNPSGAIEFLASPETEYHTIVTDPEHRPATDAILDSLFTQHAHCTIHLDEIPAASHVSHRLRTQLALHPHARQENTSLKSYGQTTPYTKQLVKRKLKRLQQGGTVTCDVADAQDFEDNLNRFFTWHDLRFGDSITRFRKRQLSENFKQFYRNLSTQFAHHPEVSVLFGSLSVESEPTALQFLLEDTDTTYYLLSTYHPTQHQHGSPGSVLGQEMVNRSINQQKHFDFLRGDEAYKLRFSNLSIPLKRYTVYPSHIRKIQAQCTATLKSLLKPLVIKANQLIKK